MLIEFDEKINIKPEIVYSYFQTPAHWANLFSAFGKTTRKADGWYIVPLKKFPIPLVAQITRDEPNKVVAWTFKGFWRGKGEVIIKIIDGGVHISGFESISLSWLPLFSKILERYYFNRKFQLIWASGWRKLKQIAKEK